MSFPALPRPLAVSIASLVLATSAPVLFAAEIEGGGGKANTLKPPERVAEPKLATASDDPAKSQSKFKLPPGFTSKLWAAEPFLGNPVAFCLDEKGVVYTAETYRYRTSTLDIRHYMFMLEDDLAARTTDDRIAFTKKNFPSDWQKLEIETEVVRRIEDKDGDGKADTSTVYAADMKTLLDGINSGVLAHDGKVWCTNMPNLWLFQGLTAQGAAAKRESLSFGYGVRYSFTGHDMHGLALGPDGRLYFSFGDRGAYVKTKEGKTLAFSDEGAVFRCEPDGSHMEVVYRGLRNPQELAFDNHGNLFTGDNDCDQGDRERWVYIVEGGDAGWRVGWQHPPLGKERNMWLIENLWKPRQPDTPAWVLSPIMNIPDGPSGVVHNPGTGLPAQYDDAFLVCGFKGSSARSTISWWTVKEQGAGFATVQKPTDFIGEVQATDVDFGPDSRVYFTDWGEGWEGVGKGRVFRLENAEVEKAQAAQIAEVKKLLGEGFKQRPTAELAKLLAHKDQRIRLNAQWALATKPDGAQALLAVAKSGVDGAEKALSRLHGVWGVGHVARLAGYKNPAAESQMLAPLAALLADSAAEVRAQTAKVLGEGKVAATQDALVKTLKDESTRVKFFAAQSLAKLGKPAPVEPVLALLRDNADKDEFIRHAGANALASNPAALSAAAKDASASVRLAALLALRRAQKPEVAQFLADADPALVKEAARAINDEGIAPAYPQLAALIAKPVTDEQLMLRVLNANFRAGTAATAQALADYAAADQTPEPLRIEALAQLAGWAKPAQRDRVAGVFRPLAARDAAPAVAALKSALPKLIAAKSSKVGIATIDAVAGLGMKDAGPALAALMAKSDVSAKTRAKALETLAKFDDPKLSDAIKLALTDKDSALRIEATALLGKLDPDAAATQLAAVFANATPVEKQQIISSLGDLKGAGADKVLSALLDDAKLGKIPAEAQLELIEAAGKRKSGDVKAKLSTWIEAQTLGDKLGRYSFALAGGDRANGERLFKEHAVAQCFRCHKVQGTGGEAGPEITGIAAKKDRRYLLESIVDPNATIAHGFESIICTMTSGDIKAGILKSETADLLVLETPGAGIPPQTVKKADVKSRDKGPSGMPPGMGELLSKRDLRDILEYVSSLK